MFVSVFRKNKKVISLIASTSLLAILLVASPYTHATSNPTNPQINPVATWNNLALATVRLKQNSDAQVARLFAMLNVAMYDAVNGIESRRSPKIERTSVLVPVADAPHHANIYAAASAAAHAVLALEYPDQQSVFTTQLNSDIAVLGSNNSRVIAGKNWGASVGTLVRTQRVSDGSTPSESQPAGAGPGVFRAAWSGTQFRNLAPFVISNSASYVTAGPPAMTSVDYAAAFAEVAVIGSAANVDNAKLDTFRFWSLGSGTSQPPGAWMQVGLDILSRSNLSLPNQVRLFGLLSVALSDVVAPTVATKYTYQHWRPTTAIREADTDNNPATTADPQWASRSGSVGTSPEHISGHSSFSAAGAMALTGFFCKDNIPFTLLADSAPNGLARSYTSLSDAAYEAGRSRVLGGIHFEFSNQAGLAQGRAVAKEVLAKGFLRKNGPTHFGECPL